MTLLNRASDGLASVLVAIVRALREVGPLERSELIDLLAPGTLGEESKRRIRETINRWSQLGLFVASENTIALASEHCRIVYSYSKQSTLEDLRRLTLELVLKAGSTDSDVVDDAIVGAWWVLTVDPFSESIHSWTDAQHLLNRQFPGLIQNDTRWNGLIEWAHLWGLIQPPGVGTPLIPCPAEALGWHLTDLVPVGQTVAMKKVLIEINKRLPIIPLLSEGPVESTISKKLPLKSRPLDALGSRLSVSLSLALHTLKAAGRIELKNMDTAEKWYLTDVQGSVVTHLTTAKR